MLKKVKVKIYANATDLIYSTVTHFLLYLLVTILLFSHSYVAQFFLSLHIQENFFPSRPKVSSPLTQNSFAFEDSKLFASLADPVNHYFQNATALRTQVHRLQGPYHYAFKTVTRSQNSTSGNTALSEIQIHRQYYTEQNSGPLGGRGVH